MSLTVVDAAGCQIIATALVEPSTALSIDLTATATTCGLNNGSLLVSPLSGAGGYTYEWSNPLFGNTAIVNDVASGDYSVTVTDIDGCSTSSNINVDSSIGISLDSSSSTEATCNQSDGSVSVVIIGGTDPYTYEWDGNAAGTNAATVNNLPSGTYNVTVTDGIGCTLTTAVSINDLSLIHISEPTRR